MPRKGNIPWNKGIPLSDETKAKISASLTGRKASAEAIEKTASAHRGMKRSEETKKKMSEAKKGNKGRLGKPHSEESKQKMSKAKLGNKVNVGRQRTEEFKEKCSKSARGWMYNKNRTKWYELEMPDGSVQKVQGSYELRYAKYLLSKGIEFTCQPSPHLKYVDQFGGTRTYRPDFWVPSLESYVEIKSTYTLGLRGARKKLEMVQKAGHPLIILTEVELSEMGIDMKSKIE